MLANQPALLVSAGNMQHKCSWRATLNGVVNAGGNTLHMFESMQRLQLREKLKDHLPATVTESETKVHSLWVEPKSGRSVSFVILNAEGGLRPKYHVREVFLSTYFYRSCQLSQTFVSAQIAALEAFTLCSIHVQFVSAENHNNKPVLYRPFALQVLLNH